MLHHGGHESLREPEVCAHVDGGDVIEGLYAIGEVTGGFHGAAYMTGTSLGKGAVFGRRVALDAAARLGETTPPGTSRRPRSSGPEESR